MQRVPFHRPTRVESAAAAFADAARTDAFADLAQVASERINHLMHGARTWMTTSCTAAIEMASLLADIEPGDEVIVPSFAFPSVAGAYVQRGASLRFADVDPSTMSASIDHVLSLVTERTKAIVVVHYGGRVVDLADLCRRCDRGGIQLVEDCAHSFPYCSASSPDDHLSLRAVSFHETKNLSVGEGGALVTADPGLIGRAQVAFDKGTDRARFTAGEVERYRWISLGSSFEMSAMLAPVLVAQLDVLPELLGRREARWRRYRDALDGWAAEVGASFLPADGRHAFHTFAIRFPDVPTRVLAQEHLARAGVATATHFEPLHVSPMGRRHAAGDAECPMTERWVPTLARLPLFDSLSEVEQDQVIDALIEVTA